VIRAFPQPGLVLPFNDRIFFSYTPEPFSFFFIDGILTYKFPTRIKVIKILLFSGKLPGIKKTTSASACTHQCLSLISTPKEFKKSFSGTRIFI